METYEQAEAKALYEMKRLKAHFPFRIVWAAIHPQTNEVITGATPTRRQVNDLMRRGYQGYTL